MRDSEPRARSEEMARWPHTPHTSVTTSTKSRFFFYQDNTQPGADATGKLNTSQIHPLSIARRSQTTVLPSAAPDLPSRSRKADPSPAAWRPPARHTSSARRKARNWPTRCVVRRPSGRSPVGVVRLEPHFFAQHFAHTHTFCSRSITKLAVICCLLAIAGGCMTFHMTCIYFSSVASA